MLDNRCDRALFLVYSLLAVDKNEEVSFSLLNLSLSLSDWFLTKLRKFNASFLRLRSYIFKIHKNTL